MPSAPHPAPMSGATTGPVLRRGRYVVRLAVDAADVAGASALRQRCFAPPSGSDADAFDARCDHVLIEPAGGGRPVACFRMLPLRSGADIGQSYAAQFYDLSALSRHPGPMTEIGRFCVHPDHPDPDILRLAWGAVAHHVDANGVALLFGCASFAGTDPAPYRAAWSLLAARHAAPPRWRPGVGAPDVVRFAAAPPPADVRAAMAAVPPLLRTYLGMGGWVSDHAVVDAAMDTLHVFTAVEVAAIPAARARALRAVAAGPGGLAPGRAAL